MKIIWSPQRSDEVLAVSKAGEKLFINGDVFDFSSVVEGDFDEAWIPPSKFISSQPRRIAGDLQIVLVLPYREDAKDTARFPDPIVNPPDGELTLPT
jgi:hypothetical protein